MDIKVKLVEKTSKQGNKYFCIEIPVSETDNIVLFPSQEQALLLKLVYRPKGQ